MSEKPPVVICEICGNNHPASFHKPATTQERTPWQSLLKVYKDIIEVERGEVGEKAIRIINQELNQLFPTTGPIIKNLQNSTMPWTQRWATVQQLQEKRPEGVRQLFSEEDLIELAGGIHRYQASKTEQGATLYLLSSFLRGRALSGNNALQELRETMKGKKVLILGDDVGVLSETLNVLGAEAVGIERDDYDVRIAHSGILAENGQPQKQVLQGDLWDIADESSTLFHQLKEKGPFDLVYSYAVYNDGSGFSESPKNNGTQELLIRYNINIEKLMKNNGLQIHEACEKMPGSYIAYGIDEGYFYLQWPVNQLKDEQASRSFSELKRILDDNCIPLFHRIYGVRGHLLTEISPMLKALRSRIEELKKSKE